LKNKIKYFFFSKFIEFLELSWKLPDKKELVKTLSADSLSYTADTMYYVNFSCKFDSRCLSEQPWSIAFFQDTFDFIYWKVFIKKKSHIFHIFIEF